MKKQQWINVDEKIPKDGEIVIGVRDVGDKYIYDISAWSNKYYKLNNYIYWLPLSFLPSLNN